MTRYYATSSLAGELGRFTLAVTPQAPTYYLLRYLPPELSQYGGSTSKVVKVRVRPSLWRPVAPAAVRAGRRFVVYGSLRPRFPAGEKTVSLKLYRLRNHHWVLVKTLAAVNANSTGSAGEQLTRYRLRLKLKTRGKYRFAATAAPAGWVPAKTRPGKTLVVK